MMKDYYRIIGVLNEAEDIVVRAAYKALAQRYHPDRWVGDKGQATRRMAEINEAYSVLSDPIKRKQYDETTDNYAYQEEKNTDELSSSVENEWKLVEEYYPDLVDVRQRLGKISKTLLASYQILMLEKKDFDHRLVIAKKLENEFMEKYFGTNSLIKIFAKDLFFMKRIDIVRELNTTVSVLGTNVDADLVINKLKNKYDLKKYISSKQICEQAERVITLKLFSHSKIFIKFLGGHVELLPGSFFSRQKIKVILNGRIIEFKGYTDFVDSTVKLSEKYLANNKED